MFQKNDKVQFITQGLLMTGEITAIDGEEHCLYSIKTDAGTYKRFAQDIVPVNDSVKKMSEEELLSYIPHFFANLIKVGAEDDEVTHEAFSRFVKDIDFLYQYTEDFVLLAFGEDKDE